MKTIIGAKQIFSGRKEDFKKDVFPIIKNLVNLSQRKESKSPSDFKSSLHDISSLTRFGYQWYSAGSGLEDAGSTSFIVSIIYVRAKKMYRAIYRKGGTGGQQTSYKSIANFLTPSWDEAVQFLKDNYAKAKSALKL